MTVWQPTGSLDSVRWSGMIVGVDNFVELDRAAAEAGGRVADEGVRIAQQAGLEAEPLAIKATGPVWRTIVDTADSHDAAAIVIGSRGLTGVRSMLLGSVSSAVVHHAGPAHAGRPSPQRRPRWLIVQLAIEAKPPTMAP